MTISGAEPAVALRRVSVRFFTDRGAVTALENVSIDVAPGDFVTILGPSGCGKSTLLRVVADIIEPASGTVRVFGHPPAQARLRREIGFVFQDAALLGWRNAIDNVRLPQQVGGGARSSNTGRDAEDLLALVGLTGWERAFPRELSGGMRQRVAIARALDVYKRQPSSRETSFTSGSIYSRTGDGRHGTRCIAEPGNRLSLILGVEFEILQVAE